MTFTHGVHEGEHHQFDTNSHSMRMHERGQTSVFYPHKEERQRVPFDSRTPQELQQWQVQLLLQAQHRREGRRRSAFPKRRSLTFPQPRDFGRDNDETFGWTDALHAHLVKLGLRTMNTRARQRDSQRLTLQEMQEYHRGGVLVPMGLEELAEVLMEHCDDNGPWPWGDTSGESRQYSGETMWRHCEDAARATIVLWRPDFTRKLSESGQKGGRTSKRTVTFTPDMLDNILHFSKSKQAKRLGCSVSTVTNLRARHPHYSKPN
jgi:hypothetical protein